MASCWWVEAAVVGITDLNHPGAAGVAEESAR